MSAEAPWFQFQLASVLACDANNGQVMTLVIVSSLSVEFTSSAQRGTPVLVALCHVLLDACVLVYYMGKMTGLSWTTCSRIIFIQIKPAQRSAVVVWWKEYREGRSIARVAKNSQSEIFLSYIALQLGYGSLND